MSTPPKVPQAVLGNFGLVGGLMHDKRPNLKQCNPCAFDCDIWRKLLPDIQAKIGELIACPEITTKVGNETVDVCKGVKCLTDLAAWINKTCDCAYSEIIIEDCYDPCH